MQSALRLRLGKERRLRSKDEIQNCSRTGRKISSKNFTIVTCKNNLNTSRICLAVSRKVSTKAVKRNVIRRRLKEIFRTEILKMPHFRDYIFIAKPTALGLSYADIRDEVLHAISSAKF